MSASTLAVLGLGVGVAEPSAAGTAAKPPTSLPTKVQHELDAIKAKGGHIDKITVTPYTKKGQATAATRPVDQVSPAQLPTGCGLYVYIYNIGTDVYSSNLTACLTPQPNIDMLSQIGEDYWVLWFHEYDTVANDEKSQAETDNLALDVEYDCSGDGTHDFQTVTEGTILANDGTYTAQAYDDVSQVKCG
ncbi:hypothetical protein ACFOSC_10565 [Streptantibioticus rubrisoli]|uniref:hypothetical protein n=1 Tax=Streptantibioticus rubrisoli TaxID=1387313 RepID=UPI0021097536|nr:hypothetical protein [Streptantibioticus rubrisoli]